MAFKKTRTDKEEVSAQKTVERVELSNDVKSKEVKEDNTCLDKSEDLNASQPQSGWQWTPRDQPRDYYYRPRYQGRSYGGDWRHGGYYRPYGYYRPHNGGYEYKT